MPIRCTFALNGKTMSTLNCPGFGMVPAFSGKDSGRDNPNATGIEGVGPIPKGTYYILDRQSGGHAGCTTLGESMDGAPPITPNGLPCGMRVPETRLMSGR